MNTLSIATNNALTMSSRVIADLVQSRHANVIRSIERLMSSGVITGYAPTEYTHEQNNQPYYEYLINKRDSYVVVAQMSPAFTAALVDRWQELEANAAVTAPVMPQTYIEALEKLIESEKQKLTLVDDVNRIQKTCNTLADQFAIGMTPCQFARQLNGVNIRQVMEALYKMNWLFKQGSDWMVAAYARDKYLKQEMGEIKIREGVTRVCPKATLTKKGAKAIYKMYIDGKLPMKSDWDGHQTHILFSDVA